MEFLFLYDIYSVPLAALAVTLLLLFLVRSIKDDQGQQLENQKFKAIPKVSGGIPFFGHAIAFATNPRQFLLECKKKYGSPFAINLLGTNAILFDGKYHQEFFSAAEKFLGFDDAIIDIVVPEYTLGLHTVQQHLHVAVIRKQFQGVSLKDYQKSFNDVISQNLNKVLPSLQKSGDSCVIDSLEGIAWSSIAACSMQSFFGSSIDGKEDILKVFISFHKSCFKIMNTRPIVPRIALKYFTSEVQADKATIRKYIIPEVLKRREKKRNISNNQNVKSDNFLDHLLDAILDDQSEQIDSEKIIDYCMTLIFSAMVTTASTMVHVLNDLAGRGELIIEYKGKNCSLLEALEEELQEREDRLTFPLLDSFIYETIRMSPLPIQQARKALTSGIMGGYQIPKDSMVYLSGLLASEDPDVFDDPNTFIPTRFLQVNINNRTGDPIGVEPVGLFPFGVGRHVCVGRFFAMAEIRAVVSNITSKYRLAAIPIPNKNHAVDTVPAYRWHAAGCDRYYACVYGLNYVLLLLLLLLLFK